MAVKLGIIGLGHVSFPQIEALALCDSVELVAGHDIEEKKRKVLPVGSLFFDDLEEMLVREAIDVFLVSTPNTTHYEIARKVLERGRPLLLEKPACESWDQFQHLSELAAKHNTFFSIALHAAFGLDVLWWYKNVKENRSLGPITGFESSFYDPYFDVDSVKPEAIGFGGSWMDSGINALSVLDRFLPLTDLALEEVRKIAWSPCKISSIQCKVVYTFPCLEGHGLGIIDTNWALGLNLKVTRLHYGQTGHEVELNHSNQTVALIQNGALIWRQELGESRDRLVNHYVGVFEDLAESIQGLRGNVDNARVMHDMLFAAEFGIGARRARKGRR